MYKLIFLEQITQRPQVLIRIYSKFKFVATIFYNVTYYCMSCCLCSKLKLQKRYEYKKSVAAQKQISQLNIVLLYSNRAKFEFITGFSYQSRVET